MVNLRSRKARIVARLTERLALDPRGFATHLELDPLIRLFTDIDTLLWEPRIVTGTLDLTGAGSAFISATGLTVPAGKRWRMRSMYKYTTTGAARAGIQVGATAYTLVTAVTAATSWAEEEHILDQGDQIGMFENNDAGDGARVLQAYILEEDAY